MSVGILVDTWAPLFSLLKPSYVEENKAMGNASTTPEFNVSVRRDRTTGEPYFEATCRELGITASGLTAVEAREELGKVINHHFQLIENHLPKVSEHLKRHLLYRNYVVP
jgi:hypothetical protein